MVLCHSDATASNPDGKPEPDVNPAGANSFPITKPNANPNATDTNPTAANRNTYRDQNSNPTTSTDSNTHSGV